MDRAEPLANPARVDEEVEMRTSAHALAWSLLLILAFGIEAFAVEEAPDPAMTPTELMSVTLDDNAIPEQLAGILFFRKIYPTDAEIAYGGGFIPPNTFARYVESGELGIRPLSDVRIVRAGSDWAAAEVVAGGDEAVVEAGDTFVMQDVPWDQYGSGALGEMWTPRDDARVVGFAIRENSRCCSMTHTGMQSPWYGTLTSGVAEMRGSPVTLRILRWDVPAGASLPAAAADIPTIRFLDSGTLTAHAVASATGTEATEPVMFEFTAGRSLQLPKSIDPEELTFENAGGEPAVVYELQVEPATSN